MASDIVSLSLPVRFLSAGKYSGPGFRAADESVPASFLLLVRDAGPDAESSAAGDSGRQAALLSPGAEDDPLPAGFSSGEKACFYRIRFRNIGRTDTAQVHLRSSPFPLSGTAFSRFSYGFHQLVWESAGLSGASDLCDYMLSVILLTLQDDSRRAPRSAVAARMLEYIRVHCCERLTLPDVARALGYSEDYLSRLLHEQVSCTFRQYIHRLRMQRAKEELLSGTGSIQEIAENCGYPNAKFFSTSFQKFEGLSPSAYRNLYASGALRESGEK